MVELERIAQSHKLKLLEDAAQAIGGSYQHRRLGSIGDAGAFSLQFNKIITCGEGGLITTSNQMIHQRMLMYQDVLGGVRNNIPADQILPGANFRMSELQGAVAGVQLQRLGTLLDAMRQRKTQIKASIVDLAQRQGITFRHLNDVEGDTAIALIFFLPSEKQAVYVANALSCEGVESFTLYTREDSTDYHVYCNWSPILNKQTWSVRGGPWHWHNRDVSYSWDMCPRSLDLLRRAVHLDISPDLTDGNIEEIVVALRKVLVA